MVSRPRDATSEGAPHGFGAGAASVGELAVVVGLPVQTLGGLLGAGAGAGAAGGGLFTTGDGRLTGEGV